MLQQTLLQEIFIPASTELRPDIVLIESAICKSICSGNCGSSVEPIIDLPTHFYNHRTDLCDDYRIREC